MNSTVESRFVIAATLRSNSMDYAKVMLVEAWIDYAQKSRMDRRVLALKWPTR
jgi:hypothetical protein